MCRMCRGQTVLSKIDEIWLAIPNQISIISMHLLSLVKKIDIYSSYHLEMKIRMDGYTDDCDTIIPHHGVVGYKNTANLQFTMHIRILCYFNHIFFPPINDSIFNVWLSNVIDNKLHTEIKEVLLWGKNNKNKQKQNSYAICKDILSYPLKFTLYGRANSVDPNQNAPKGAVWSGSTLFATVSESFNHITR